MRALTAAEFLDLFGEAPKQVVVEMTAFSEAAIRASEVRADLVSQHPQQWVGIYDGKPEIFGDTFQSVMDQLEKRGFPREEVVVQYLDNEEKSLIL